MQFDRGVFRGRRVASARRGKGKRCLPTPGERAFFLHRIGNVFLKPGWGEAGFADEGFVKAGIIGKTAFLTGVGGGKTLPDQPPGQTHPLGEDVVVDGGVGVGFEPAAQMVLADEKLAAKPV